MTLRGLACTAALLLAPVVVGAQSAADHIALGDTEHAAMNAPAALEHYRAAVKADSTSYEANWKASREAVDVGEFDADKDRQRQLYRDAESYARAAVKANLEDAEGHFALARALGRAALSMGSRDRVRYAGEVRQHALEALRLNPKHAGALHVLGMWNAEVMRLTSRVKLGTTVLVLPHRHPVLTAKMLATLDHLAPGRVVLGAGVGWMKEEIELFGVPFARRGAWSDEAIRIMRACWSQDRVSFKGEFFSFEGLGCRPRPANGTIPIWIGGHTERALQRVATLGDGWHAAFPTAQALGHGIEQLREACRKSGRDFATLSISARLGLSAKRPADDVLAELRALRDLGISHVILETRMRDVAELTTTYEKFATQVRPRL
jgi:probable F420-dependent oxidoreductase